MTVDLQTSKGGIKVDHITVVYEGKRRVTAIKDLTFDVKPGEFLCILGPSGCGKSTTLSVIAGFIKPTYGKVIMDHKTITGPEADRGVVFQHYELFPWKTVLQNVEFGPRMNGKNRKESKSIAQKYIKLVGLEGFENSYPFELSAGMSQRIALARTLANDPSVLLKDEPFGSVDAQTRLILQELLLKIWRQFHKTIIFVTHEIDEAIFLSDRIIVMTASPGTVKKEIINPLSRPRTRDIITTQEYAELKKEIFSLIREEVLKTLNLPEVLK
jgi:ABC-type nitrate/sulfonate/bicarbonate transport system ATPase subunit